jgi:predicted deacetylase
MKKEIKKKLLKSITIILFILLIIILAVFMIRNLSERQLDDVSPEIYCEPEVMEKADIFYVIPKFNNQSISQNKEWCEYILSLNKTLGLHGVYHTYEEFLTERDEAYLQEGIDEFEKCFGYPPAFFEPPQVKINDGNKKIIREKTTLHLYIQNIFHKVYHCSDTGRLSNNFIDWI